MPISQISEDRRNQMTDDASNAFDLTHEIEAWARKQRRKRPEVVVPEQEGSIFSTPPPSAADTLFGGVKEDWSANACISYYHEFGHAYKMGFRIGALRLAEKVCSDYSDQDLLVYPIVYLYRHYLELVLKEIFRSASRLVRHEITEEQDQNLGKHGLKPLWGMIEPMLGPVCVQTGHPPIPEADIDGVRNYIEQFHDHDPDGQRFRYATIKVKKPNAPKGTKEDKRSLKKELSLINIRAFATNIEKLADYLDGLSYWLADMVDRELSTRQSD